MRENLATYRKMEGVKPEYFQDREAQPHWVAYVKGMRLFEEERFDDAIVELEKVPGEFLSALEECKAECEGPYHSEEYSYLKYQSHLYEAIA
ncbi:prolyl 3-hydroxylase 1-like, partial [Chiloscyllium plagiosum]|uniref:prolyl 3-hydroxylase 1-like n=1 Tax=Chiloscyllium plagiosum TaxID=36176 RepID=UPI001CB882C4